ncbi:hypothetical protein D092_11330 [Rhodococcus ruber Chol-4]|uniref:hypothetical protein n=1 Tax=Rhodococcus TaxID=1827 RepID=UPI00034B2AA9|nr:MULTISPECIES: hypothetical protein [Rhodococcus]AXY52303.1 hypothetical protein YT1_2894 [Rhodococcus ruber]KXF86695.1 hypothetical protein D092_11330 [Rhodococcus ruber Chol-4]UQB75206.1 hypothetical protein KI427_13185 [Rhodococcus ruber]WML65289.1 hypothetical protein QNA09_11120 [Rhodococcus sp. AH-ZY2]
MTWPTGSPDPPPDGFVVEYLSPGVHAHGFGRTEEGRPFSFRVRRATLRVEVYRPAGPSTVPTAADVIARARASVAEIDLGDERSVAAAVRDTVARARPCRSPTWLDRVLGWLPGR